MRRAPSPGLSLSLGLRFYVCSGPCRPAACRLARSPRHRLLRCLVRGMQVVDVGVRVERLLDVLVSHQPGELHRIGALGDHPRGERMPRPPSRDARRRHGRRRSASQSPPAGRRRKGAAGRDVHDGRGRGQRAGLDGVPENVTLEVDLPFEGMKRRLEEARVVALPVGENTDSARRRSSCRRWRSASPSW